MPADEELVVLGLGPDLGAHGAQLLVLGHLQQGLASLLHVVLGAADRHLGGKKTEEGRHQGIVRSRRNNSTNARRF